MNLLKQYLAANERYRQSGFHEPRKLGVKTKAVILTCMDSRWAGQLIAWNMVTKNKKTLFPNIKPPISTAGSSPSAAWG
jgi:hypothetical protein